MVEDSRSVRWQEKWTYD